MNKSILDKLVGLSQRLGDPAKEYIILGEGNTSARADDESFFVKASGMELATIGPDGFCQVYFKPVHDVLMGGELTDDRIKQALGDAMVHGSLLRPSV